MIGGLLPLIGTEVPCRCSAANVPLRIDGLGLITLDFHGRINIRVEERLGSGPGVKLKVMGYQMSAGCPALGKVTIRRADIDMTPLSRLELVANLPLRYRQILFLDFHMMIERPPGGGRCLVLSNARTARLTNDHLTAFPPQGAVYQLQEPVDLAPHGVSHQGIVRLLQLPITVSHDP
jgi:hypothetical protein